MKRLLTALALCGIGSLASAASVQLGVDPSLVTIDSRVAEARYRLNQTNWDEMVSNGADPITAANIRTADLGTALALNGDTFDFSLSFENGDSGPQGFTFTLVRTAGGPALNSTLVYDVANPINGQTPIGFFDGLKFEARAGVLDEAGSAQLTVTNLAFSSSLPSSGSLPNPINVLTPPVTSELFETWITADTDLGAIDWVLSGTVTGSFSCSSGTASCLREESIKINVKVADVTANVVPLPAAAWLFVGALGGLAALRRRSH
jgi:hypothetical protein